MAKEITLMLDDDVLAKLAANSKGKDIETHLHSILVSAASKPPKKPKVVIDSVLSGPALPQINPLAAAVFGKVNAAIWTQNELCASSDRAAGIVGGTFVDDSLCGLIKEFWKRLGSHIPSASDENAAFKFPGPLSSFSARIVAARASGIIGPATQSDLNAIREVRNAFAHWTMSRTGEDFVPVSFEEDEIREWCSGLLYAKDCEMDQVGGEPGKPTNPRDKFILTVSMLGRNLVDCSIGVMSGHLTAEQVGRLFP